MRRYERGIGVIWLLCKLKAIKQEMFVITLIMVDGGYRFEDINSPSIEQYEALPIVEIR